MHFDAKNFHQARQIVFSKRSDILSFAFLYCWDTALVFTCDKAPTRAILTLCSRKSILRTVTHNMIYILCNVHIPCM